VRGCVVNLVGHGSCIMGHGSVFVWVSGLLVTACDPLFTLSGSVVGHQKVTDNSVSNQSARSTQPCIRLNRVPTSLW